MRILGRQFVLGQTIKEALANAEDEAALGYRFSFDMLGEAARTEDDASRYASRYLEAAEAVAAWAGPPVARDDAALERRPGLSVKLSALHPRYQPSQQARLHEELVPRLTALAKAMREAWLPLTIDAEEADRLDLSLALLEPLLTDPALAGWNGLGFAIQAYSKRVLPLIDWLAEVASVTGRRIPVRLVKGAYWDSEIKWAQEAGLAGYPVFSRKVNTDVAYLAAARALLAQPDCFYPQFATHNAQTIAAVAVLAGDRPYEFQRLYGMGEALHREVVHPEALGKPCRIYAPVGGHRDLLAYLVRRLLENGANTSFVNRLADDAAPIAAIVADPIEKAASLPEKANPLIPLPPNLFMPERRNSLGLPLFEPTVRLPLLKEMTDALASPAAAGPIVSGEEIGEGREVSWITSPHDRRVVVGACRSADSSAIDRALDAARGASADWDRRGGDARATILERAADLFETDCAGLMALLVREAGKTIGNAQSDLREAVDHLRYAAAEARRQFAGPRVLKGPTGELNELSLHGRGVFACISPWNFPLAIFTGQVAGALAAGNTVVAKPAGADAARRRARGAAHASGRRSARRAAPSAWPGRDRRRGAGQRSARGWRRFHWRHGNRHRHQPSARGARGSDRQADRRDRRPQRDDRRLVGAAGAGCGRCADVCLRQRGAALLGAPRAVPPGRRGPAHPRHAARRGARAQARRSARLCDGCRAGDRRGRNDRARSPQSPHASRGARAARSAAAARACATEPMSRRPSTRSPSFSMLKREVFGPILHVVRFDGEQLGEVCDAINATGYGLTLGLHSRIKATADFVAERVKVGNLYVNRNQIGAVVGVQPFGGEGLSGTGPKAGGPHYLQALAVERVRSTDTTASGGNASLLAAGADEP